MICCPLLNVDHADGQPLLDQISPSEREQEHGGAKQTTQPMRGSNGSMPLRVYELACCALTSSPTIGLADHNLSVHQKWR